MTDFPYKNLREALFSIAEKYADRPAFLQKRLKSGEYEVITFRQFVEDFTALGAILTDMGIQGKRIAIMGANCYQWIVSYMACINGLGVVVPLDRELRKHEVDNLVNRAECDVVFGVHAVKHNVLFDLRILCH